MSNNLSKQLCELCGIERKGKLIFKKRDWDGRSWISAGRGYKEFDFKSIPEIRVDIIPTKDYDEKNGFQYPYSDIERIKREYDKNGYDFVEFSQRTIDFTKPENFVRLYEILHGQSLEDYLKYLCIRITYEKGWSNEAMKAAIREAEWVYD